MTIQDIRDITSFKWATIVDTDPLLIKLDGDTTPLGMVPDSLIDPQALVVGDRVRVELSQRKVVIHGRSQGDARVSVMQEWAALAGPTSRSVDYIHNWARTLSSGPSMTAMLTGIEINEDGIYDIDAAQRANATNPTAAYATVALNGDRTALEDRAEGVFKHGHAAGANNYSTSGYFGPLYAGEKLTFGVPSANATYMVYGANPYIGWVTARRIA